MKKTTIEGIEFDVVESKQEMEGIAADRTAVILCLRVNGNTPIFSIEKDICFSCQKAVWISPTTKRIRPENSIILCLECAKEKIDEEIKNINFNKIVEGMKNVQFN